MNPLLFFFFTNLLTKLFLYLLLSLTHKNNYSFFFWVKKSCRALRRHHVLFFFFLGQKNLAKAFSAERNFSPETETLMRVQRLTESMVEASTMVIWCCESVMFLVF